MRYNLPAAHTLLVLMIAAYLLRLLLIVNGGQFYFPDESRYQRRAVSAVDSLFQADFRSAIDRALAYDKHHGFTVVGMAPALFHRLLFHFNPPPGLTWSTYWVPRDKDYRISALVFALPSALSIGVIYLLARRAGAGESEALIASFLLAASNTFFVFAKHFLPYDTSILIGLTALWLAFRQRETELKHAITVGILAFLCLWIYYGHITLVVVIAAIYCGFLASSFRAATIRVLGMAIGVLLIAMPIFLYNSLVLDIDIVSELVAFSASAVQGEYSEGFLFPFVYFVYSEAGIAFVWMLGLISAVWRLRCQWGSSNGHRALLWLASLFLLYLLLALLSSVLQISVVYGRIARTMAPFIVMACGYGFSGLLQRSNFRVLAFAATVCMLALANFLPAIKQEYFIEVARRVQQDYKDLSYETTLSHPATPIGVYGEEHPFARYKLLNAGYFYPITEPEERPPGQVLVEVSHPFNHRPWQYEGMTGEMREIISRDNFKIWLLDTEQAPD